MPLQIRRGTTSQRLSIVPLAGEPIYDTDQGKVYIGDGVTAGGISAFAGITSEDAVDLVGAALANGVHDNIIFSYNSLQDVANRIDASVDLSNYTGEIQAQGFRGDLYADDSTLVFNATTKTINIDTLNANTFNTDRINGNLVGSVFGDNSTLLINGIDNSINLDGTVKGDIIPDLNEIHDIGSSSRRFKDLWLSGTTIYLGNSSIIAVGSAVNLPAGSTIDGVAIGTGSGFATGDGVIQGSNYNINIVGDNSSLIVNSATNSVTGDTIRANTFRIDGTVRDSSNSIVIDGSNSYHYGSFFGDLTGTFTGAVLGNINGDLIGDVVGSVFSDDSSLIVNGIDKSINAPGGIDTGNIRVTGQIRDQFGNLIIDSTNSYHYGSFFGDLTGTFTGSVLGNITGDLIGDVQGSVFSDDSSLIVNGIDKSINAPGGINTGNIRVTGQIRDQFGNLIIDSTNSYHYGSFFGDLTGPVTGNVTGNVTGILTGSVIGFVEGDLSGSVFSDNSTLLVDGVTGTIPAENLVGSAQINVTGDLKGNLRSADNTLIVNASTKAVDAAGGLSTTNIIASGLLKDNALSTVIDFATSTHYGTFIGDLTGPVTGNVIGTLIGDVSGDLSGSVFSDNSTLLVDGITGTIPAENLVGSASINVTGTITGPIYTNLINSADSSEIVLYTKLRAISDIEVENEIIGNLRGGLSGDLSLNGNTITGTGNIDISGIIRNDTTVTKVIEGTVFGVTIRADQTNPLIIHGTGSLGASSGQVYCNVRASKGTILLPITTAAGDTLGGINIQGFNGSTYKTAALVVTSWDATATLTDTWPKSILRLIAGGGGSTVRQANFDSDGVFNAPVQKTTVYSAVGTAIPSASTVGAGARAFVSDATLNTFGSLYTSGGANSVPVYSNGTSWYIG